MTWDILYDQRPLSSVGMTKTSGALGTVVSLGIPTALGAAGASSAQGLLQRAGADGRTLAAADVDMGGSALGGLGRYAGYGALGSAVGALGGGGIGRLVGGPMGALGGATLGALGGVVAGGLYGAYRGYRAPIERAQEAINNMGQQQKVAGLFMRPSDVADHKNLAAALESKLNGADQGAQFKTAPGPMHHRGLSKTAALTQTARMVDAGVGAVGGLVATNRLMNRVLAEDSPIPPPEEPRGLVGRVQAARERVLDYGTRSAREYPVTAHLLGTATGALAMYQSKANLLGRAKSIVHRGE